MKIEHLRYLLMVKRDTLHCMIHRGSDVTQVRRDIRFLENEIKKLIQC